MYYFAILSKEETNNNQKRIRDLEWDAIKNFIKPGAKVLDVGCGAGDNMIKVQNMNCEVFGVDPNPGEHGVGRYDKSSTKGLNIQKGISEKLPFKDRSFDIVFCSHVLEHVSDEAQSLNEMKRVLKADGRLIIGMPTATMSWICFFTHLMFTTHIRMVNVFLKPFINTGKQKFIHIFLLPSHSDYNKTILYDFKHYKVSSWRQIISNTFDIEHTILPAVYPYPEYIQLFKPFASSKRGSSVFFICNKYPD